MSDDAMGLPFACLMGQRIKTRPHTHGCRQQALRAKPKCTAQMCRTEQIARHIVAYATSILKADFFTLTEHGELR
jgi:hypothetical protein